MVKTVTHFFKEMDYQLEDGFSVNTGFFSVHPNIGGVFHSEREAHDHKKHPVTFRYQSLKPMRNLQDSIEVIIEGKADVNGFISEFTDVEARVSNAIYVPGDMFILTGDKVKTKEW